MPWLSGSYRVFCRPIDSALHFGAGFSGEMLARGRGLGQRKDLGRFAARIRQGFRLIGFVVGSIRRLLWPTSLGNGPFN